MRECFIFRTHKIDESHKLSVLKYKEDLKNSKDCDLVVSLNINLNEDNVDKIIEWWSLVCIQNQITLVVFYDKDIREKCPFYQNAWLHSQYCFTSSYEILKEKDLIYDFYWFIEYDAKPTGSIKEIIYHHRVNSADLIGSFINSYKRDSVWFWWNENPIHLDVILEKRWKYFPALTRLSQRFLEKLVEDCKQYYSVVESFIPTMCVKHFGKYSLHNLDAKFWVEYDKFDSLKAPLTLRFTPPYSNDQDFEDKIKPSYQTSPNYTSNKLFHPIK